MKKLIVLLAAGLFILTSCSKSVTIEQAANGKAKCKKYLRG